MYGPVWVLPGQVMEPDHITEFLQSGRPFIMSVQTKPWGFLSMPCFVDAAKWTPAVWTLEPSPGPCHGCTLCTFHPHWGQGQSQAIPCPEGHPWGWLARQQQPLTFKHSSLKKVLTDKFVEGLTLTSHCLFLRFFFNLLALPILVALWGQDREAGSSLV